MSDYLDRLVERSLGLAEPVLPRPVALFEAASPSPALPVEVDESLASEEPVPTPQRHASTHDSPPAVPSDVRAARPAADVPPGPASAEPGHALPSAPHPAEQHAALRSDRADPPGSGPPVHLQRDAPATPVPAPERAREPSRGFLSQPAPEAVERVARKPSAVGRLGGPGPQPFLPRVISRETRVERTTLVERAEEERRAVAPVVMPAIAPSQEVPRTEVLRPAPAPRGDLSLPSPPLRVEQRPEPPGALPPADTGSTIQVTIGRLEVRAAPPANATPPRTRQLPAVMSLDDYLRQRASGNRP